MAEITMPKMGDGMEEGTINSWLKKEGDQVKAGDAIAEVETDKANVEIAAYETGTLSKIIVQVGQTVPVGAVIAVIGSATAPKVIENVVEETTPVRPPTVLVHPPIKEPDTKNGGKPPIKERVKASPLARATAEKMGLELAKITGSGPGGRIIRDDVTAHVPPPPPPDPIRQKTRDNDADTTTELDTSKMRQAIARRTVQSKQNTPHFYVTMLIEMDRALALLKELNVDAAKEEKVTVNDIIVKACARSLAKVPEVNATWTSENTIRRYTHAHIGIAVGIDDGLIIPVVRDCHKKTLRDISVEAKQLITKARNNQLKPEEYQGSTFSVSNLGMMGVDEFIAIINPPEAAILAIGGIAPEPVVIGDTDEIVIRSRMKVTISADHRLLDGVVAARFLQEVKKALEAPFSLLS